MAAKEELTQAERDKLEIDPDFDFRQIAERPFEDLTKSEIGMFKWSGVYHQLQTGYFMIRLRMPGGLLTADQLRRAGKLCTAYGQDQLCITTRQCLQFHWIRQQDIYKVIEGMSEVGVLTRNACGDVCRNVVGCPGQGSCKHEIGDTGKVLLEIADDPELLNEQRNLPRKHKINIVGCGSACGMEMMNCQGWHPVTRKTPDGTAEYGWQFLAGGGLGQLPHLAKPIFAWVPEHLVKHVARAGVEAHNRHGNRRKRKYARLKIIVADRGQEQFAELILDLMRERGIEGLDQIEVAGNTQATIKHIPFEGDSVIPEKTNGSNTVRVIIRRSEFTSAEASQFADWADEYGDGSVMFTQRQNLQFPAVKDYNVQKLLDAAHGAGFRTEGFEHLPDVVACVGTTMCNLAVSDTPNAYRRIVDAFADQEELWKKVGPLRINMNGCPTSCAHHWLADIGLRGRRTRTEQGSEEGFTITVGSRLDGAGYIGEPVVDISATDVVPAIRALLDLYLGDRAADTERFADYVARVGAESISEKLATIADWQAHEPANLRNLELGTVFTNVVKEAGQ